MAMIHPVILCGGSGTRLWPRSRKLAPKPFIPLLGEHTLFQQAVMRCGDSAVFASPTIIAGEAHVPLIEAQSPAGSNAQIIVEPYARNTAPAIALAAARLDPDAVMLVCPSDHHIADGPAFVAAARKAAALARDGALVSFGIAPDRPETGYGYLKRGEAMGEGFAVSEFVEKPDQANAEAYLASGHYAWNGGIFAFRAGQVMEELANFRPEMAESVREAVAKGRTDGARFHPDSDSFAAISPESIDYALMENTAHAAMVPVSMGWSDIGSWASLQDALPKDSAGNRAESQSGAGADMIDCRNVLAISDGPRISAVGLEDICIIVDGDEVLVTTREGAQKVGKLPGASEQ